MSRRVRWLGLVILLVLSALLGWWLWPAAPTAIWQATRVPYDPTCAGDTCVEFARMPTSHMGRVPMQLYLQPEVDDPIAQLGDCLDSVIACVEARDMADPNSFPHCVEQSICPATCKAAFSERTHAVTDLKALLAAFEGIFIAPGGLCTPSDESGSDQT